MNGQAQTGPRLERAGRGSFRRVFAIKELLWYA